MPQHNEFGFTPHPKLAVEGWQANMRDDEQRMPIIEAKDNLTLHAIKRKDDNGKMQVIGFALYDATQQKFVHGSEEAPVKDIDSVRKHWRQMLTPEPAKAVDPFA